MYHVLVSYCHNYVAILKLSGLQLLGFTLAHRSVDLYLADMGWAQPDQFCFRLHINWACLVWVLV